MINLKKIFLCFFFLTFSLHILAKPFVAEILDNPEFNKVVIENDVLTFVFGNRMIPSMFDDRVYECEKLPKSLGHIPPISPAHDLIDHEEMQNVDHRHLQAQETITPQFLSDVLSIYQIQEEQKNKIVNDYIKYFVQGFPLHEQRKKRIAQAIRNSFKDYLIENNLKQEIKPTIKQALLKLFSSLNFTQNNADAELFHTALWHYPKECAKILNEGSFDFQLSYLREALMRGNPTINILPWKEKIFTHFFDAKISEGVFYYGIIKFIGQYTNDQDFFNECEGILLALEYKIQWPLASAQEVRYFIHQNENFGLRFSVSESFLEKEQGLRTSVFRANIRQDDTKFENSFAAALAQIDSRAAVALSLKGVLQGIRIKSLPNCAKVMKLFNDLDRDYPPKDLF